MPRPLARPGGAIAVSACNRCGSRLSALQKARLARCGAAGPDAQNSGAPRAWLEIVGSTGDRLLHDHARLDALFVELLDQFAEGNRRAVRAAWAQLDDGLAAHMAAEERHLLPLFEKIDLRETLALKAEHVSIRRMLAELGVGIDLDLVQPDLARAFIATLRAHARREDELLYRWANRRLRDIPLAGEKTRAAVR